MGEKKKAMRPSSRKKKLRAAKFLARLISIAATLTLGIVLISLHDRIRTEGVIDDDVKDLMATERIITIVALVFLAFAFLLDIWVIRQEIELDDGKFTREEKYLGYKN